MNQNKINKRSVIGFSLILAIGLSLSGLRTLINFITDYQWFNKNNYIFTFLVKIKTEAVLILPIWILITIGLYFYLKRLKNKYYHTAHIFFNVKAASIPAKPPPITAYFFEFLAIAKLSISFPTIGFTRH